MTLKTKYESIQIAKAKYYQTKQQDPEFIERIRQKIQRVLWIKITFWIQMILNTKNF